MKSYLFKSQRLGFRNWSANDLEEFVSLNADTEVMQHFPKPLTKKETEAFIIRLQNHFNDKGYTYFAVEVLETKEFIGFIGLAYQEYEAPFTPATDIGWRLKKSSWGKGFATEGAKRCLEFAFSELSLSKIVSTCTLQNKNSERVMQKIGMTKQGIFKHPRLQDYPEMENCVWYMIDCKKYL